MKKTKTKFRTVLIDSSRKEEAEKVLVGLGVSYIIENFCGSEEILIIYTRTDAETFQHFKDKFVLLKVVDLYW